MVSENVKPIQKILFGSPGTGKSYKIREIATEQLGIDFDEETKTLENTVKTVFHPEYTYSDFIGKLLPQTQGNTVIYKFYPGHFLRALGMAYRNIIDETGKNCLLAIDELNRGNAAAIFGSIFQLLDREEDNWSSYEVDLSDLELVGLFKAMNYKATVSSDSVMQVDGSSFEKFCVYTEKELKDNKDGLRILHNLKNRKVVIPHNLSIIATINTSDESIYYMDSAFKRRWDWQHVEAPSLEQDYDSIPKEIQEVTLVLDNGSKLDWYICVIGMNEFIKSNYQTIRRLEDKQIGWWFIRPQNQEIQIQQIKDKIMFYLWDSVFARDKKPLETLLLKALSKEIKSITYTNFVEYTDEFLTYVSTYYGLRSSF